MIRKNSYYKTIVVRGSILFFITSFILLSCNKNDMHIPVHPSISFLTLSKKPQTSRAEFKETEFGVTAYHYPQSDLEQAPKIYSNIQKSKVIKEDNSNLWRIEGEEKFWPSKGSLLFTAYAPFKDSPNSMPKNFKEPYSYSYKKKDKENIPDFLFSDIQFLDSKTQSGPVPIKFNHAAALISVKITSLKNHDDPNLIILLNNVRINNLLGEGSVNILYDGIAWHSANDVWDTKDFTYNLNAEDLKNKEIKSTHAVTVFDNIVVIPQTLKEKSNTNKYQSITLDYTIKSKGETSSNEVTFPLRTKNLKSWNIGKHTIYSININTNNYIEFEGSTNDWDTAGNDVIIE